MLVIMGQFPAQVFGTAVFFGRDCTIPLPATPQLLRIREVHAQQEVNVILDMIQREMDRDTPAHDRATEAYEGARKALAEGRRLSCQARVEDDVVVDVPSSSQVHRQVVRKAAEARDIELYPLVKLHYVEVAEPDMQDPSGDANVVTGTTYEFGPDGTQFAQPVKLE